MKIFLMISSELSPLNTRTITPENKAKFLQKKSDHKKFKFNSHLFLQFIVLSIVYLIDCSYDDT